MEFETDECSVCEPQMCYSGQIQTWDCETSYGHFGTHKYTETYFVPTSRGYFNINCKKDPQCCEKKTAMLIPGIGNYVQVDENPAVAMLVNFTDFRLSNAERNTAEIPDEKLIKSFSQDMESLVEATAMDNTFAQQVGVISVSGEVSWLYGTSMTNESQGLVIVSGDENEKTRDAMLVESNFPILPILAIGPHKTDSAVRLTVSLTPFEKTEAKIVYDGSPEIHSNRLITVWRKVNLSNETPDSYGTISLEIYDKKTNCPISRTVKPFIYRKSPNLS